MQDMINQFLAMDDKDKYYFILAILPEIKKVMENENKKDNDTNCRK